MKITVVLLHYWRERTGNIGKIIESLASGSVKPDKIILFNNNPEVSFDGAINSNVNYGGRARYIAALLEPSDYYYFIDDDTNVYSHTLENFVKYAKKGCCLGYRGKILLGDSYRNAKEVLPRTLDKPKKVDLLVGNGTIFAHRSALLKMLKAEEKLSNLGREEDLILSMSNESMVIPVVEANKYIVNLPDGDVGYQKAENHWDLRERMVKLLK